MNPVSFPTQGEVIQFAFDALGVLPRKHDDNASFDETQKKSTQKALQRLALEEGTLDQQRLGEMIQKLSYLVAGSIPPRECLALGDTLLDLFEIYRNTLKNEGTFLTKSETAKYFLLDSAAFRLPMSVAKHMQRYNVAADGLIAPADAYWYLPSKAPNGWIWPLEKVMRWVYELAGTSIHKFHISGEADLASQEKNLESAKKWLAGLHTPSWPALLKNFNNSFDALDRGLLEEGRPALSGVQKNSIRIALFLARVSTYISKSVQADHGDVALQEFCSRYEVVADCVGDDTEKIRNCVEKVIARHDIPASECDGVWFDVSTDYWVQFADRHDVVSQALTERRITFDRAAEISSSFGRFSALLYEKPEMFALPHSMPEGISEAVLDGLALRKDAELSIEKIEAYATRLNDSGLRQVLPWIVEWQLASYHYRAGRYEDAYPFIQKAFDKAQYCAGGHQYLLVNQYIELAAKNEKWRDFKRGIEWATYLNIEVRWLRKDEPTDENLKFVFVIMKKAVYAM